MMWVSERDVPSCLPGWRSHSMSWDASQTQTSQQEGLTRYHAQLADSGLPLSSSSLSSLPPFSPATVNVPESTSGQQSVPEIAKTGLGSSAAMVTAVVAGLLQYFGVVPLPRSAHSSTDVSHSPLYESEVFRRGGMMFLGAHFDLELPLAKSLDVNLVQVSKDLVDCSVANNTCVVKPLLNMDVHSNGKSST